MLTIFDRYSSPFDVVHINTYYIIPSLWFEGRRSECGHEVLATRVARASGAR